jgi:GGDEF domain-containing protein
MSPKEYNAPLNQQQLVVRAQSKEAPHRIGVTTTSAQLNGGLTFRAYSSGHIVYRPYVDPLDPAVSYAEQERPIESAIALPAVEGERQYHSKPPAVIYVASKYADAFDTNDFLMIRVMARLVGEIVETYNSRGLNLSTLTDALADPIIIDSFYADFLSDTNFTRDLTMLLLDILKPTSQENLGEFHVGVNQLTLIGLDINGFSDIQRERGDHIGRIITRDIGRRILKRMKSSFTRGIVNARMYRMWGDRFYLLVRDEDPCKAKERADHIRREVNGLYELDNEVTSLRLINGPPSNPGKGGIEISIRMAGADFSRDELLRRLEHHRDAGADKSADKSDDNRDEKSNEKHNGNLTDMQGSRAAASLSHLLQDGLEQANDLSDIRERSVWWNARSNRFEHSTSAVGVGDALSE